MVVPFGKNTRLGVVDANEVEVRATSDFLAYQIRPIKNVVAPSPFFSKKQLELARFIADYYHSSLYQACALMLPPKTRITTRKRLYLNTALDQRALSDQKREVLKLFPHNKMGAKPLSTIKRSAKNKSIKNECEWLLKRGYLSEIVELSLPEVRRQKKGVVRLVKPLNSALSKAQNEKQKELIGFVSKKNALLGKTELKKLFGVALDKLLKSGVLEVVYIEVLKNPLVNFELQTDLPPTLSSEQKEALDAINSEAKGEEYLLFGDTGTGKTEVYLNAIKECLKRKKGALLLVPEIALTPQIIARISSRFPGQIGVIHSKLSASQKLDQWLRIRAGQVKVVVGPRSAIFSPLEDVGLVVVDEEHEQTYKQSQRSPRYDVRTVARKLVSVHIGAKLVFGSATPSVDVYKRVEKNLTKELRLTSRPFGLGKQTENVSVNLVDMRIEREAGNRHIFSNLLSNKIRQTLALGDKVILMLNRRGVAVVVCSNCNRAYECPNCETSLVLHRRIKTGTEVLLCHYCGKTTKTRLPCKECAHTNPTMRSFGIQSVLSAVKQLTPNYPVIRWDSDTATKYEDHKRVLSLFSTSGAAVLVGTQMVAKGLDVPDVGLAAAVLADSTLDFPDYRSDERTFQLITQLIGRAGRGKKKGYAIVQTNQPDSEVIKTAIKRDYLGFYKTTLQLRAKYSLPPLTKMVRLIYGDKNLENAYRLVAKHRELLEKLSYSLGYSQIEILGPTPCLPLKIRGTFYVQLLIKGAKASELLDEYKLPPKWVIDVDPLTIANPS